MNDKMLILGFQHGGDLNDPEATLIQCHGQDQESPWIYHVHTFTISPKFEARKLCGFLDEPREKALFLGDIRQAIRDFGLDDPETVRLSEVHQTVDTNELAERCAQRKAKRTAWESVRRMERALTEVRSQLIGLETDPLDKPVPQDKAGPHQTVLSLAGELSEAAEGIERGWLKLWNGISYRNRCGAKDGMATITGASDLLDTIKRLCDGIDYQLALHNKQPEVAQLKAMPGLYLDELAVELFGLMRSLVDWQQHLMHHTPQRKPRAA